MVDSAVSAENRIYFLKKQKYLDLARELKML